MATSDGDPRLVNKIVRTPGRNISKLKKFFDKSESASSNSNVVCSEISESNLSSHSVNTTDEMDTKSDNYSNPNSDGECINETVSTLSSSKITQNEEVLPKSQVKISTPDIPYCRKVSSAGELWKNVDIGVTSSNEGLWTNVQNTDVISDDSHYNHIDSIHGHNSFVSSAADLHDLIASSRAELSKTKEPEISDKSMLENYFTSFENTKPNKFVPLEQSSFTDTNDFQFSNHDSFRSSAYDCDVEEMNFEEEEATLSDTSSDEEIRCNAPMNNHYIPTYSLHTIIEESCEESSRGATPTNEPATSKLERYFSWDIINETELKRKEDDDSTVYSDSLSEISGSLNGDMSKEVDPSQLASSRLEKYFTSGLVGNENYFYPDDAEFLEDGPVSDFDEDSTHQKISRSALLSSLETLCDPKPNLNEKDVSSTQEEDLNNEESLTSGELLYESPKNVENDAKVLQDSSAKIEETQSIKDADDCDLNPSQTDEICENHEISNSTTTDSCSNTVQPDNVSDNLKDVKSDNALSEIIEDNANIDNSITQKQTVNKEQLAMDAQAIIKKLLMYFSGSGSNSYNNNKESDYKSAWMILETEIERLIQSIPSAAALENNSCNSSTIDSNNSDYGSDTIESLDCMTDEDETTDPKMRSNTKYPFVDLFNATYKPGYDFPNFNISDETLSIWKRLIQSLQKDNFCMNDNKLYDPNTEARLYIRDQIVNLMHTVTVNENKVDDIIDQNSSKTIESALDIHDKEIASSLVEESNMSDDINEAYNISIGDASLLTCLSENEGIVLAPKTESSSEYVLEESSKAVDMYQSCSDSDVDSKSEKDLNANLPESVDTCDNEDVLPNKHQFPDKNVDEVDLKLDNICSRKVKNNENRNFSIFVDIELSDAVPIIPEPNIENETLNVDSAPEENTKRSSLHMWVSGEAETKEIDDDITEIDLSQFSLPLENPVVNCAPATAKIPEKSYRDTGYYSFKSSDDSLLNDTPPPDEFMDVPNFKSLKRSVKKFPLTNTLSKSTNNINQVLSSPDAKFSTLQLKPHKSKRASNSSGSPSRQFTSLFSPSAVFKKLTGQKNVDAQTSESSIPPKYLKKYARSSSVENENILGAISMPQLNIPKSSDSYSALGLYPENDRDSSLMDEDMDIKRYSAYSHSVLSLGAHSASMTSVYSAAGCHYGYVTVSGDVLFGLNYNQKSQMMEVFVKQCRNLAAVDSRRNKSDPYVKVYLLPDKTKSGKRKTKTKKNTCNPVFNELLRFPVLKHELESRTLWLSVWNSDLFGRNDFLGEILLPLGYRLLDSPTLRWYPLQERMESLTSPLNYKGELFLALKYVPRDLSLESRFRPAPVISLRGALHVLVKEARNISANGSGSNLDAFCKSYLLPDKSKSSKQKTPVVKRSRHPKWYYTMIYEDLSVDELKERSLELTVWDHDKLTSNEFMGGVRLNIGSGLYHGVPVDWMDARRDEASLWQSMLESPNMWVDGCLPLRPTMQFHHG